MDNLRQWKAALMAAAAEYHCHSVGASWVFGEIVGSARPRLRDVQDHIARLRVQANEGSLLLKSIEQKRML
jgi:hypothetical protein